jgi:hypothetical protein
VQAGVARSLSSAGRPEAACGARVRRSRRRCAGSPHATATHLVEIALPGRAAHGPRLGLIERFGRNASQREVDGVALCREVKARHSAVTLVSWISQTFLQLVLLSIIIVGQNVLAAASDKRAESTYEDAEAVLHEAREIQQHLLDQDKALSDIIDKFTAQAG